MAEVSENEIISKRTELGKLSSSDLDDEAFMRGVELFDENYAPRWRYELIREILAFDFPEFFPSSMLPGKEIAVVDSEPATDKVIVIDRKPLAKPFVPDNSPLEVAFDSPPVIVISTEAYLKMYHLIDMCPHEISWLGLVGMMGSVFTIEDIYLLEQTVSASETEMTLDGVASIVETVMSEGKDPDKLRFWGHSHVNMGVFASSQDNSQMDTFKENGCPWFIRGIFNKDGKTFFSLYHYEIGVSLHHVPWCYDILTSEEHRSGLKAEIQEKVSTQKTFQSNLSYNKGNDYESWRNKRWDIKTSKWVDIKGGK